MAITRVDSCPYPFSSPAARCGCGGVGCGRQDYSGGELLVGALEAPRGQGDAVVFRSYMAHSVYPVVKGERCALVAWARGRLETGHQRRALEASVRVMEDLHGAVPVGLRRIYGAQLLHGGEALQAAQVLRQVAIEDLDDLLRPHIRV